MKIEESARRMIAGFAAVVLAGALAAPVFAEKAPAKGAAKNAAAGPEEKAIRESAREFEAAFNKGDAAAIAAQWIPDGSLVIESGEVFRGRKEIEQAYTRYFKRKAGTKIEVGVTSVEFPAEGVAVEDGISTSVEKDGTPSSVGRYTAVHVSRGGKWLMSSVRETGSVDLVERLPLDELDWLVGKWVSKRDKTVLRAEFRRVAGGKFIQRDYVAEHDGKTSATGIQIIGWDGEAGRIRSWSFDSSGGHGTAFWKPLADGWELESVGAQRDGTPFSSRDFLIRVPGEDRVLGWRSVERRSGEARLPDTKEIVFDRVPSGR